MTELTSLDNVKQFIANNQLSFLYISRTDCGVCHALLPQVEELLKNFPKIKLGHINADHLEEVAGQFSIFTVPSLLMFVDGKEYIREARFVHMHSLEDQINKIYHMVVTE